MAHHHLIASDATIRAVRPDHSRDRLNDGSGLHLKLFVKGGSHGWRFDYSLDGRRNTISLAVGVGRDDTVRVVASSFARGCDDAEWDKPFGPDSSSSRSS